ncbi:NUDIX domain-containing protein [uncultured Dokdonia sp.]|uniref:NUDIX domain-containing protein n=1 Tax=uncultured Dokdonia sp. TaxID=575653 RepID=UPI00260B5313|nr:NUDIX domain-containing protein [uncultured Dokdonia sp.]
MKKIDKSRLIAIQGDKILVLEKVGSKKKYSLAGGIKKKKETTINSLVREIYEEIGVDLSIEDLTYFLSKKDSRNKNQQEISKHYYITEKAIEKIQNLEPHKFKNVLWIFWYDTLEYLDKEDRTAVTLYFDQYK